MKKQLLIWTLSLGLIGGLTASAEKAPPKKKAPPQNIVLKACQKRKPPVAFPHDVHAKKAKLACKKCHHKGKPDKKMLRR